MRGIISGVLVLFFMMKEQKPFALFIFGFLLSFIMFLFGNTVFMLLAAIIPITLAELICCLSGYSSIKWNMISFAVFNMWTCSELIQMLLAKEKYMKMCRMMGEECATKLESFISPSRMALVYTGAIAGGIIGAFIARTMLKKHFAKAGLV